MHICEVVMIKVLESFLVSVFEFQLCFNSHFDVLVIFLFLVGQATQNVTANSKRYVHRPRTSGGII